MPNVVPRILLSLAALILAGAGVVHAMAFSKALTVIEATNMPAFYANSFKGLWLIDSATLISLAMVLALVIARPATASKWVLLLLALIPAATAGIVYYFVGPFFAPHTLAAAALMIFIAGLLSPGSRHRA